MRSWIMRHPVRFLLYYTWLYLCYFTLLEHSIRVPELVLHCRLDDLIPFCKYAIVPYYLWFAWIVGTFVYMLLRAPREEFWRFCLPFCVGQLLALTFCALVPNGVRLRPRTVPGNDIFAQLVRGLYRADTATNVFPSIHVLDAVTLDIAYHRSSCFDDQRRRWVRVGARVLDLSIILSTLLLKQHSVLDALAGVALALSLDLITTHLFRPSRRCLRTAL